MSEAIAKMAVILCCVLAWQTFSKSRQIKELEVELSLTRYQAEQFRQRISEADAAEKTAAAARAKAYEETRRILFGEPEERDGTVAPALRDAIGRLP